MAELERDFIFSRNYFISKCKYQFITFVDARSAFRTVNTDFERNAQFSKKGCFRDDNQRAFWFASTGISIPAYGTAESRLCPTRAVRWIEKYLWTPANTFFHFYQLFTHFVNTPHRSHLLFIYFYYLSYNLLLY